MRSSSQFNDRIHLIPVSVHPELILSNESKQSLIDISLVAGICRGVTARLSSDVRQPVLIGKILGVLLAVNQSKPIFWMLFRPAMDSSNAIWELWFFAEKKSLSIDVVIARRDPMGLDFFAG
jgi:hypothetical protein